jgi:rubrerythrin
MGEFGSIDEVLEFAVDREIEANQLYEDLAARAENPTMRKVFEDFAKEELGHKAKLEAMKISIVMVQPEKVSDLKIADYIVDVEASEEMDYKDVLVLAMKKEKASFNLYKDLAEEVEDEAQRQMFLLLAQEEARHKLCFEIEYDNVILKED